MTTHIIKVITLTEEEKKVLRNAEEILDSLIREDVSLENSTILLEEVSGYLFDIRTCERLFKEYKE